jgi:hypothetical protein
VRRERQAAQDRAAKLQADMLDHQRRAQATEDLVARLKRELRELEDARQRRRWWRPWR